MRTAKRIEKLPPYLFAEIDRKVAEAKARGADIISFGVGDPDLPTPPHIIEALTKAAADPATHRYPSYTGMPAFRESIASWYGKRFGVTLDADERQYLHDLAEVFATFHVDLLRAEAVRDVVLVAYRERAIGRGSGIEIDADGCEVWYFDELGRPLRFVNYASWEEALNALDE